MKYCRNAPLTATQVAALKGILASHGSGTSTNPGKRKRRVSAKAKNAWKKRFKSRKAMVRYMAKIRNMRKGTKRRGKKSRR